jgi:hypothetical protein
MNQERFHRTLTRCVIWLWVPCSLLFMLMMLNLASDRDVLRGVGGQILGVPVVATNGSVGFGGFAGFGLLSVGGLAVGGIALGGGALGLIACGGGAVGLIALGGGAIGLIAIGGGAVGYLAIGGGACGVYVLAGDGAGRYVLSRRRQDKEAVELFCRYLPRLRDAFADEGSPSRA